MVCELGKETNSEHIEDLGYGCGINYKTSSSGKVSAKCKCKRL